MRSGTVAIIGRTNVGKSTFLNTVLGTELAIVSHQPQTTRDTLLGVVQGQDYQISFVDTPGLHRPKNELGRLLNAHAVESLRAADVVLFMTDVLQWEPSLAGTAPGAEEQHPAAGSGSTVGEPERSATRRSGSGRAPEPRSDAELIALIPADMPAILVVNKVDRLKDKARLFEQLSALNALRPFAATVPISARAGDGTDRVLAEVVKLLGESTEQLDPDTLTDRPLSFFAREYIREQILGNFGQEVPHAVAVTVDAFEERPSGFHVAATIHVEKAGQRAILVGKGGERIRDIGMGARARLAALAGQPVHLKLFVRVTEAWRSAPRRLADLGYGSGA